MFLKGREGRTALFIAHSCSGPSERENNPRFSSRKMAPDHGERGRGKGEGVLYALEFCLFACFSTVEARKERARGVGNVEM